MMPETLRTARPVGLGHHLPTVLGISSQLVNAGTNVATVYLGRCSSPPTPSAPSPSGSPG